MTFCVLFCKLIVQDKVPLFWFVIGFGFLFQLVVGSFGVERRWLIMKVASPRASMLEGALKVSMIILAVDEGIKS